MKQHITSSNEFYYQMRPPAYYKMSHQLAPPEIPERFQQAMVTGNEKCEPYGPSAFVEDENAILIDQIAQMHPNMQISEIQQKINSIPNDPVQIKQMLKELAAEYISQLYTAVEYPIYGNPKIASVECEQQRDELVFMLNVLQKRSAEAAIKRELEKRIQQKKKMAEDLRTMRQNVDVGKAAYAGIK
uniref:Uncharacterized protein n=1 Tax=Trepomonas sp. PC1 TaxID=1076344 RepID=A0A146K7A5_9EUKA|eukprot:JAP92703.1 Hypothetical protein TPC1_15263 [Trepomonas sp. PC1]